MLLQQLEVALVGRHQLYRHPDVAEGFAIAQVVGDDVRIEQVVVEAGFGGGRFSLCGRLLSSGGIDLKCTAAQQQHQQKFE